MLEFTLKTPWADGTTALLLSPQELLEKLAALVPPPRLNLVRYHAVLAPNAVGRSAPRSSSISRTLDPTMAVLRVFPAHTCSKNDPITRVTRAWVAASTRQPKFGTNETCLG